MTARVLRAYTDKNTSKNHKVGETVDLKEDRFELLKQHGFVAAVSDDSKIKIEFASIKKENAELKAQISELNKVIENAAKQK